MSDSDLHLDRLMALLLRQRMLYESQLAPVMKACQHMVDTLSDRFGDNDDQEYQLDNLHAMQPPAKVNAGHGNAATRYASRPQRDSDY